MTCDARFHRCQCSLDTHPDFIPHHCTELSDVDGEPCGGLWLDDPDDPEMALVVRYPVNAAIAAGVTQPTEPVAEAREGVFRMPRGVIKFVIPPSLLSAAGSDGTTP